VDLLEALLGSDPSVAPLKPFLIQRTQGNPLFLEESVRALVETGPLVGARGAHRLERGLETVRVPATVQAILAARIDRLSPEDKRVLQAAAVVGTDVPLAVLRAIVDTGEDELRQSLARLQVAELVYEARLFPELEFAFNHALTHELKHPLTSVLTLWFAASVYYQRGDRDAAAEAAERLVSLANAHGFSTWVDVAIVLPHTKTAKRLSVETLGEMHRQVVSVRGARWRKVFCLCVLGELYAEAGFAEEGRRMLGSVTEEDREAFFAPEVYRIEGEPSGVARRRPRTRRSVASGPRSISPDGARRSRSSCARRGRRCRNWTEPPGLTERCRTQSHGRHRRWLCDPIACSRRSTFTRRGSGCDS
jgi:hypothetical protein